MAKGKGKKGKAKGPEKPENMSDEHWLIYNNYDLLMQNLRGPCVFNTIHCTISRAQAAYWFWQQACTGFAKKVEIVNFGIVPQAIAAFKAVDPQDKPSCIGLIHALSEVDAAREQLIETRPIPPHPAINLVAMLFDTMDKNTTSMAIEVSAVGTLKYMCENIESRKMVSKYLRKDFPAFNKAFQSQNAGARADAASALKLLMLKNAEQPAVTKAAEEVMTMAIQYNVVPALLAILEGGCAECTQGVKLYAATAIQNSVECLHKLIPVEETKSQVMSHGGIETLVKIIGNDVHPAKYNYGVQVEVTLQAKAAAAGCLCWITVPREYQLAEFKSLLGTHFNPAMLPHTLGGTPKPGEPGEENAPINTPAPPSPPKAPAPPTPVPVTAWEGTPRASQSGAGPASPMKVSGEELPKPREPGMGTKVDGPILPDETIPQVRERLRIVIDAGSIPPLMQLCIPPGGLQPPDPGAGGKGKKGKKKGKKGKEPPLPPGKAEAYTAAAGTLRHLSLLENAREQIRANQGILALTNLLTSKVSETRLHAQGALLNLGMDREAQALMVSAKVPPYIVNLSAPHHNLGRPNSTGGLLSSAGSGAAGGRPLTAPTG